MNYWTELSIEYANNRSYLDDLFSVYPTIPEGIRSIGSDVWGKIEESFNERDNSRLFESLLALDLFPIKDSYVSFFKRDRSAIERNPRTINRLCGRLYEMGLDKIYERCCEPKETNRQIGPFFRRWLVNGALGMKPVPPNIFTQTRQDAILDGSDEDMKAFATAHLGYTRDKGLDLVCRFNGKYVIGEAKFLTDWGGHQNAQFADAISTLETEGVKAIKIGILDGVAYVRGNNKMYRQITEQYSEHNILSALVLREFLYSL